MTLDGHDASQWQPGRGTTYPPRKAPTGFLAGRAVVASRRTVVVWNDRDAARRVGSARAPLAKTLEAMLKGLCWLWIVTSAWFVGMGELRKVGSGARDVWVSSRWPITGQRFWRAIFARHAIIPGITQWSLVDRTPQDELFFRFISCRSR